MFKIVIKMWLMLLVKGCNFYFYPTVEPGAISWSGVIREMVFLSLLDAARSIPWDSIPRSFRGSRLAMIMIFLPFRSSWF